VDPEAVTLVMQCDDRIVGFVAGVTSVRRFYRRFMLSHGVGAVIAALPALRRPEVRRRLRETAGYPTTAAGFDRALPEAELLSIAVDPRWRRHGVASSLTERLLDSLGRRGVDRVRVVVGSDNAAGNSLYERAGFVPAGRITVHDGTESRLWVAKCGSS
jgi:ribosomal protein S18 acetylase RimI-like enzyme